jgi:hypothetical protein
MDKKEAMEAMRMGKVVRAMNLCNHMYRMGVNNTVVTVGDRVKRSWDAEEFALTDFEEYEIVSV